MLYALLVFVYSFFTPYPIDPMYLQALIEHSDVIVYANVLDSDKIKEGGYPSTEVTLEIKEELKRGLPIKSLIKVGYEPNMICPNPASYHEGKKVIAFLKKGKSRYHTVALSYGTKYKKDELAKEYLDRVKEYLLIDKSLSPQDLNEKRADWLIKNFEYKSTEREAKLEIERKFRIYNNGRSDDKIHSNIVDLRKLNTDQRVKLMNYTRRIDNASVYWFMSLYKANDLEFQSMVAKQIEKNEKMGRKNIVQKYLKLLDN